MRSGGNSNKAGTTLARRAMKAGPLAILVLFLTLSLSAVAQDNETTSNNATAGDNTTSDGNATDAGNDTNETPTEPPAPAGPRTIVLEGVAEGGANFFRGEDGSRNPVLTVEPGQEITFQFKVVSGAHNLHIETGEKTAILSEGDDATLTWTAPAEGGTVQYWCDPHKSVMKSTIQVGGAPDGGNGGGDEGEITGATVDLGRFDPSCEGRVAPAIVTQDIVGAPTLADYIAGCKPSTTTEERATHAADFVIPLSWALIGLGIVGVVWVHKYYKP